MIRMPWALAPLTLLAACGGGGESVTNAGDGATFDTSDMRSYEGDNLTSIDAAANDAAIQPLAPDIGAETPDNTASGNAAAAE